MKRFLIVVDMQKDFVDGSLGTPEAVAIVDRVVEKIKGFEGKIFVTFDTHPETYLSTCEGRHLPVVHCVKGTEGWALDRRVADALAGRDCVFVEKETFGAKHLPALVKDAAGDESFTVELIGLCTDICVVSNALLLKAHFPETEISVDASCCSGVTPETHEAALTTMKMCQIGITGQ